jgi:hypothetical protein
MAETVQLSPPYGPYNAFEAFVQKLKETAVPPVVDRSTMRNLSGAGQTALLSALKFLRLVQDSGHVTPAFNELVNAFGTEGWHEALGDVICGAYSGLLTGLDIDKASLKSLRDALKAAGVPDGTTLDKTIRFYLQAMKAARLTVSPHFAERKPRAAPGQKRAMAGNGGGDVKPPLRAAKPPARPPGFTHGVDEFQIIIPGKQTGVIQLPSDFEEGDLDMLQATVNQIVVVAKRRTAIAKEQEA